MGEPARYLAVFFARGGVGDALKIMLNGFFMTNSTDKTENDSDNCGK